MFMVTGSEIVSQIYITKRNKKFFFYKSVEKPKSTKINEIYKSKKKQKNNKNGNRSYS